MSQEGQQVYDIPPNGAQQRPTPDHARDAAMIKALANASAAAVHNAMHAWFTTPIQIPIDEDESGNPLYANLSPVQLLYDLTTSLQESNELAAIQLREQGLLDDEEDDEDEEPAPRSRKKKAKR